MSDRWVWNGGHVRRIEAEQRLGGKAAGLVRLQAADFNVPPYYVVTADAFHRTLARAPWMRTLDQRLCRAATECNAGDESLDTVATEIRERIQQLELPPELLRALRTSHAQFFPDVKVAVRSSAAGEDGRNQSFAGMHATVLEVAGFEEVVTALKEVWSSAYSPAALAYRRSHGLPLHDLRMAVIVQQMVASQCAGIVFTCHPATGDPNILCMSVVAGNGQPLVAGTAAGETCYIDKRTQDVDSPLELLADSQVRTIVTACLAIERVFHRPQDIEFCLDAQRTLHILQSRPVTRIQGYGPAAGNRRVWDNSNIVESYAGVTSPMTFSFIRRAYAIVYQCFAEVMGIPASAIRENRTTFENMLGLFRGRVYYNLASWHRLVRLFPGYAYNARFMDAMMGVRESFALQEAATRPGFMRRWFVELPALVRLCTRTLTHFLRIRRTVKWFETNFNKHYRRLCNTDLESLAPHELLGLYFEMEDALLRNWKAPIINDFFVMVFFGMFRRLCTVWLDDTGALANALVAGEGSIESTEPPRMLMKLARLAQETPALARIIVEQPAEHLPQLIASRPEFASFQDTMAEFLDRYGFRCVDELKLEVDSYRDRPDLVYVLLRAYLTRAEGVPAENVERDASERLRHDAEARVSAALAKQKSWIPRRLIFRWILSSARLGVRNRENMRFARTKIYGVLRELLRVLGARLAEEQLLDDARDIFYLTFDEVRDFVGGTAVTTDLKGLVRLRRAEYDGYRREAAGPDSRFETFGMAYHRNAFTRPAAMTNDTDEDVLRGIGCCPGVVSGPVQVRRHPFDGDDAPGAILVAESTDPGWAAIFPMFAGLIIERGSPLSHSAIVARELGIPTIVGVRGATRRLRTGQHLTMDGGAATIRITEREAPRYATSSTQNAE